MRIGLATAAQLTEIDRLLRDSRYLYLDLGNEDLAELVEQGTAVTAEEDGRLWGFLAVQVEARPATLPVALTNRANLRGVGLARGRWPSSALPLLLDAVCARLRALPSPHQIVAYGSERWLVSALQGAGFQVADRIQFLRLDDLPRRAADSQPPAPAGSAQLRPAHTGDVDALLQLDGAAFDPLWRFSRQRLVELLMLCRVHVAELAGELAGYSAVALSNPTEAHLARLAVHPAAQGRGIGRSLLQHTVAYARDQGSQSLQLNAQTANARALHLYRAVGFRPIGRTVPILAKAA
jgi:ribosomal protein S18 acetylase RimI-like enzyme